MSEYPSYDRQYTATETNIWAVLSLISGVLAWLGVFGLGGIAAVITGHIAKDQIRRSNGQMSGDGIATAGLILGYLNIALAIVALCLVLLVIAGVISGAAICPFIFDRSYF